MLRKPSEMTDNIPITVSAFGYVWLNSWGDWIPKGEIKKEIDFIKKVSEEKGLIAANPLMCCVFLLEMTDRSSNLLQIPFRWLTNQSVNSCECVCALQ